MISSIYIVNQRNSSRFNNELDNRDQLIGAKLLQESQNFSKASITQAMHRVPQFLRSLARSQF